MLTGCPACLGGENSEYSLSKGTVPTICKEAGIRPIFKKPLLNPTLLDNNQPMSNLPFLGKVLKLLLISFQKILCDTNYHDPFQPDFGIENTLVSLIYDIH